MLRTRIYTILVLVPLFIAAVFYSSTTIWALILTALLLIGGWEWGALAQWRTLARVVYTAALLLCAGMLWMYALDYSVPAHTLRVIVLGCSVVFWLAIAPLWLAQGWRVQSATAMAVTGVVLLLPLWLALLYLHARPGLLVVLMAIVWISDTVAFLSGKRWGRRKLAVSISPGKTWEGVYGAAVGVLVYYLLLTVSGAPFPELLRGVTGCMMFLLLMVLGIEGDLFESWVKRTAGVKDSGTIVPGHGGILDRIDALTAAMPAAALLLHSTV